MLIIQRTSLIRVAQFLCVAVCFALVGCGLMGRAPKDPRPDLRISTVRPEHGNALKMGKNIIEVYVENARKTGAGASVTRLEVREGKNKPKGTLVKAYTKNTPAIAGNKEIKVKFENVLIPKTEVAAWYTFVATADLGNTVNEVREDNNTKSTSRIASPR